MSASHQLLRLTPTVIECASIDALATQQAIRIYDSEVRGLSCIAYPSTRVSYVLQRRVGGKFGRQIRVVLGHHPEMSLEQARTQALEDLATIRKGNIDDVGQRNQRRVAAQAAIVNAKTFAEIFDIYLEHRKPNLTPKYWKQTKSLFEREVLPHLGKTKKLMHVTHRDLHYLMSKLTHTNALMVWTFLSPFFDYAVRYEYLEQNPLTKLDRPPPANERSRVLSEQELVLLWKSCEVLSYPYGYAVQLLILLCVRENEVAGMRWAELDLSKALWEIPKERTKAKTAHLVPLPSLAVEILAKIPRRAEHVFFTRETTGPKLSGWSRAKNILDLLMSGVSIKEARKLVFRDKSTYKHLITLQPWRFHDIRRTQTTNLAMRNVPVHVISYILGHKAGGLSQVASIYNRYSYLTEQKAALDDLAAYVQGLVGCAGNTP